MGQLYTLAVGSTEQCVFSTGGARLCKLAGARRLEQFEMDRRPAKLLSARQFVKYNALQRVLRSVKFQVNFDRLSLISRLEMRTTPR